MEHLDFVAEDGNEFPQRIRMLESRLEYSLRIPINQHCVQDVWTQMKLYNAHVQGNKNHKHGAPQVHAWAALLDAVCQYQVQAEDEACAKELRTHYVAIAANREVAVAYLSRCQMKDGLYELVNKGAKKEKQFNTSLLKLQVLPEARTLANSVKGMLVKYCKAKEYHGPAPSARLERQARDKLDKVF